MITSTSNNTIKTLIKLKQKKYRDETGYYLVEGEHLVEEAMKAKQVECLISTKDITSDLPIVIVSNEVMSKLSFTKSPQFIMAKCKIKKENKIMSKTVDKVQKGKWLVYISEENGIAKVRTQNGKIGYVKNNLLDNFVTEREDFNVKDEENKSDETLEYDITKKDITTFEKRKKIFAFLKYVCFHQTVFYVPLPGRW